MKTQIDFLIITNLPSFYKINLFNKIAERRKLLVIFTHDSSNQRNKDFYIGDRKFEFISLANKSIFGKVFFVYNLLKIASYQHLIICGWDQIIFWIAAFLSPKMKNGVIVESSIYESKTTGLKGWIKKTFLKRISKAYVSGKAQADLCKALNFKSQIITTKGVGVFNITTQPPFRPATKVKNFLYVGRLSPEKNIQFLIETFNQLPDLCLNIIGFGAQESFLKSIAGANVAFHGAIPNAELYKIYQRNDVFILPSISEPWGMVIEEALNNGLPVIVSDRVGCAAEIINETNGLIFQLSDPAGLQKAITQIQDIDYYNNLRLNISKLDFERIAEEQVRCYL